MTAGAALESSLARIESLPAGVQDEIRRALAVHADVAGEAIVRVLELLAGTPQFDAVATDPAVARLLALCGMEAPVTSSTTAVAISPRPTCELCDQPIGSEHAHAVDTVERSMVCVCRACELGLTDAGRFRHLRSDPCLVAEAAVAPDWWTALELPVEVAILLPSAAGSWTALLPSRSGVVESTLAVGTIDDDVLGGEPLVADAEALLVSNLGTFEAWRLPIDRCYELAGRMRRDAARPAPVVVADFLATLR